MGTAIDGLALASATWGIRAFPAKIAPRHTMHRAVCATPSWYGLNFRLPRLPVGVVVDLYPQDSPLPFFIMFRLFGAELELLHSAKKLPASRRPSKAPLFDLC